MRIRILLVLSVCIYLFAPAITLGQQQDKISTELIKIGPNILVGTTGPNEQVIEPHLSAHPTNSNHLIGVGWVFSTTGERSNLDIEKCKVVVSRDGGKNWKESHLKGKGCADPWITLTENNAVISTLAHLPNFVGPEGLENRHQLILYFSFDGGDSWTEAPQKLGYSHDGPRSTADKKGNIYIVSRDSHTNQSNKPRFRIYIGHIEPGIPFSESRAYLIPSNLNFSFDGVTTLSDGTLLFSYQDYQRPVDGFNNRGRFGRLNTRRQWAINSSDQGNTFSTNLLISETCYDRANDLTADVHSERFKDRLYSICSGDGWKTLQVNISTDRGEEWTDPILVEESESIPGIRIEPQFAVNKNGILGVAWLDSRDKPEEGCYTPYVSFSKDGGMNFSEPKRVGNELSCPDPDSAGSFVISRWPEGGDYFGFTAAADGRFHLLWSDARNGKFVLRTTAVIVGTSNND